MVSLTLQQFVLLFLLSGFFVVFSLWFYYDRRDRRLYDKERFQRAYHCVRCGHIYAGDEGEESTCPRCRFRNARLRF